LPPNPQTHDDEFCKKKCHSSQRQVKVTTVLAQRASREMTGYHSGYTFKRQRAEQGSLDSAFKSLSFFEHTLDEKPDAKQYRSMVTRTLSDSYHNTTARPSTEEFNLSMNVDEHDVRNAEFIRTFPNEDFFGGRLLRRYDLERQRKGATVRVEKVLPESRERVLKDFEDIYGFRPAVEEVFYLSPWEFCMFWTVAQKDSGCPI